MTLLPWVSAMTQNRDSIRTNLEVMRQISESLGKSLGESIKDTGSIPLRVHPENQAWLIEGPFIRGMKLAGLSVGPGGDRGLEIGIMNLRVVYSRIRREGFLGARMIDRSVYVGLSINRPSGKGDIITGEIADSSTDAISLDDVESVESPLIPVTHGKIPDEGFFTTLAEPLVMIGALVVGIYLLFAIRS